MEIFATNYFACSEKAGRWLFGDKEFEKGNVIVMTNAIDFVYDLGLEQAVILTGKVHNPEDYYHLIDVMILPSHFEGLSLTAIEAQISKIPIVVSKAIPNEAVINDSCVYMDITATDIQWADIAESLVGKTVKLDKRKNKFNIHNCK